MIEISILSNKWYIFFTLNEKIVTRSDKMKKIIIPFFFILIMLTLVGCDSTKDSSTENVDLSEYPLGVQSGLVRADFYNNLIDVKEDVYSYKEQIDTIAEDVESKGSQVYDPNGPDIYEEQQKEYTVFWNNWKLKMENLDFSATTKEEENLKKTIENLNYYFEKYLEYNLKSAINKNLPGNSANITVKFTYLNKASENYSYLLEQMKEYSISEEFKVQK